MDYYATMKAAFDDELEKIAGDVIDIRSASKSKKLLRTAKTVGKKALQVGKATAEHVGRNRGKYGLGVGFLAGHNRGRAAETLKRDWHYDEASDSWSEKKEPEWVKAKSAAATGGLVRSGRRPMKAATLLAKDGKKKISDIVKLSAPLGVGHLALVGVGALGLSQLQKMKRRYDTGRQLEYQQRYGM